MIQNIRRIAHYNIKSGEGIIHAESYGEGNPILVINGGPGLNSQGFRDLAKILGKSNKAIIYDQRGTGQSKFFPIDSTTITIDAMVEDIELIRKHLNINEWVVLGHSFGGMLASYYATKYPEYIKGLILSSSGGINLDLFSNLDINSRLSKMELDSLNYWNNQISDGDTSYYARLQRGKYLAPAYLFDKSNIDIVIQRISQGNIEIARLVFQNMQSINFDCEVQLKKFTKPVQIIHGDHDVINSSLAIYAQKVFPNAKLKILKNCGHFGWLDQPDEYFKTIEEYLRLIEKS
jgi:proline iminopeptidase